MLLVTWLFDCLLKRREMDGRLLIHLLQMMNHHVSVFGVFEFFSFKILILCWFVQLNLRGNWLPVFRTHSRPTQKSIDPAFSIILICIQVSKNHKTWIVFIQLQGLTINLTRNLHSFARTSHDTIQDLPHFLSHSSLIFTKSDKH